MVQVQCLHAVNPETDLFSCYHHQKLQNHEFDA